MIVICTLLDLDIWVKIWVEELVIPNDNQKPVIKTKLPDPWAKSRVRYDDVARHVIIYLRGIRRGVPRRILNGENWTVLVGSIKCDISFVYRYLLNAKNKRDVKSVK